jgi:hypothetical protein
MFAVRRWICVAKILRLHEPLAVNSSGEGHALTV